MIKRSVVIQRYHAGIGVRNHPCPRDSMQSEKYSGTLPDAFSDMQAACVYTLLQSLQGLWTRLIGRRSKLLATTPCFGNSSSNCYALPLQTVSYLTLCGQRHSLLDAYTETKPVLARLLMTIAALSADASLRCARSLLFRGSLVFRLAAVYMLKKRKANAYA